MWPRKRLVRIHMVDSQPSLEGVLTTYLTDLFAGHYRLQMVKAFAAEGQTYELEGSAVRIPREKVAFVQELR